MDSLRIADFEGPELEPVGRDAKGHDPYFSQTLERLSVVHLGQLGVGEREVDCVLGV
jgi:hypothetical protein